MVVRSLRAAAAAVRYLPDRIAHGQRRARAREWLSALPTIRSVLFVCQGNICRSPFAAEAFARLVRQPSGRPIHVSSAGFTGPGRSSPRLALAAAERRGIDLSRHRSALVTTSSIMSTDLVVVMAANQATALARRFGRPRSSILVLGDLDPHPVGRRTILDPWGRDEAAFDESYDRITRCVSELASVLGFPVG